MSFWARNFPGARETQELGGESARRGASNNNNTPVTPPPTAAPPKTASVGPPPTAIGYVHHHGGGSRTPLHPALSQHRPRTTTQPTMMQPPTQPPKFQIFQPPTQPTTKITTEATIQGKDQLSEMLPTSTNFDQHKEQQPVESTNQQQQQNPKETSTSRSSFKSEVNQHAKQPIESLGEPFEKVDLPVMEPENFLSNSDTYGHTKLEPLLTESMKTSHFERKSGATPPVPSVERRKSKERRQSDKAGKKETVPAAVRTGPKPVKDTRTEDPPRIQESHAHKPATKHSPSMDIHKSHNSNLSKTNAPKQKATKKQKNKQPPAANVSKPKDKKHPSTKNFPKSKDKQPPTLDFPKPDDKKHSPPVINIPNLREKKHPPVMNIPRKEDPPVMNFGKSNREKAKEELPPKEEIPKVESKADAIVPFAEKDTLPAPDAEPENAVSLHLSQRFGFLSQEQVNFQKLEESTTKRRHDSNTRLYQMECKLASLTAGCANEGMDRDLALRDFLSNKICQPMEGVVDRILGSELFFDEDRTRVTKAGRRLLQLEDAFLTHANVGFHKMRQNKLESLQLQLTQQTQPSLKLETSKADKREGTLARRLDSIAGVVARQHHEESATRKSAITLLNQQVDLSAELAREDRYLQQLRELRLQLQEERKRRKEEDAKVLKAIREATAAMKRALLQAAGSGDN